MKYLFTMTIVVAMVVLLFVPMRSFAGDTLVVATSLSANLDKQINSDTLAGGANAHKVYELTTTTQTYWIDGPITSKSSISIIGVPGANGQLPCIQPHTQSDNSVPINMFVFIGANTTVQLQNLYLLGLSNTNTTDATSGANACAVQISADKVTLKLNFVVFDEWRAFAIGYNGQWDKFFILNCKFRNMVDPTQQYIGEVIRNEWPGAAYTDSMVFRYNTMLCVNAYAAGPVTKYYQRYFEFTHNDVIYTFKNPFFIFNETNAKIDNNVFYGNYVGGTNYQETPWWDNLWYGDRDISIIAFEQLNAANAAALDPADSAGYATFDSAQTATLLAKAEKMRTIEVKNNSYFQPSGVTGFWTALNDTAKWTYPDPTHHDSLGFVWGDSTITPTWMNSRTTALFSSPTTEPGFVQSGNMMTDPGFPAGVSSGILTGATGDGVGLLKYITEIRGGTASTDRWGYKRTTVQNTATWMPTWPLPEAASNDLRYAATLASTDGLPVGDPYWFTGTTTRVASNVAATPHTFSLSEAYPNPFNPSTNVQYSLPASGAVSLKVYNVLGQLVKTLVDNAHQEAGTYTVRVDMSNVTSGVYFYSLEQGNNRLVHKMMLLK